MISKDPYHREQLDNDIKNALSDISKETQQSSNPTDFVGIEVPSTCLPTLVKVTSEEGSLTKIAESIFATSTDISLSTAERQDVLIRIWAQLLHLYAVSEAIAFVVIDKWPDSASSTSPIGSMQLVISRRYMTKGHDLDLAYTSFVPSTHGSKINTAVTFSEIHHCNHNFSYILQGSKEDVTDLRLYAQQPSVPHKFSSALWNTLLEIGMKTRSSDTREINKYSISRTDQRAIHTFIPAPLFERRLCLHQLFHDSVRSVPHITAINAWDGSFTYAELDKLSDDVATQLIRTGVRKGQYVPFSFEKSKWMVVAILGILKVGAAFVPIDPSQPQARAKEIVEDTHSNMIVVSASLASMFTKLVDTVFPISSDTVRRPDDDIGLTAALSEVHPEDAAMVIFTSGSTGKPKGIVIEHGAISTRTVVEGRAFRHQGARTLQFAASTWDVFLMDIFTTLTFHGCVCIPNEEDRRFNLPKFSARSNVSLAVFTPSLAKLLEPSTFPALRTLVLGGEALGEDVVQKWSTIEGLSIIQGYGPAETGPCISGRVADRPEILGYALANSICILVDPADHDRLVPMGAVGELVVGGPGLLREYANSLGRTDAAVIESHSWSLDMDTPIRRFYKTGDLLRYSIDTLDGRFEFVGRKDDQIKYHGQRIEPREIELHLNSLPGVVSCVVIVAKTGYFKDRLLAVVQCNGESSPHRTGAKLSIRHDTNVTAEKVKDFLSSRLAPYMIPSEVLVVDEIPYSTSMKLDRALVSKWISDLQGVPSEPVAKHNKHNDRLLLHESTAKIIAREYARIVAGDNEHRREELEDSDFNLQSSGIDSIQIISLSMFLTRRFGVQVPMTAMLSSRSTVRTIASIIDADNGIQSKLGQHDTLNVSQVSNFQPDSDAPILGKDSLGSYISRIFLTGSSGFLGIEILRQLLSRSNYHVYALVRGSSDGDAQGRLIQRASTTGWWQDAYLSRLHVWHGDLSRTQLGLSEARWQMLQAQVSPSIDAIIHCGAKVHYNLDYDSVKATNVSSTVELLKAINSREESLHSFVFLSGGQQLSFNDSDDAKHAVRAVDGSGYARSKVVSETIVKKFAEEQNSKARHVRVVKPGFIIGDSERGLANQNDFLWRLVAASIEMGQYNEDDADDWIFVTDVTRVSQIVLQSAFEEGRKPVTKILDGMRFGNLWKLLNSRFGYDLQPLSRPQWLSRLRQAISIKQEKHVMFPLMYMIETNNESIGVPNGPLDTTAGVQESMEANIAHLIKVEFLPRPASVLTPTSSESSETSEMDVIDIHSVRQQFPALQQGIVPFNNAAGTVLHRDAIEATQKYMSSVPIEFGHDDPQSQANTQRHANKFEELATFINAAPDEIGRSLKNLLLIPPAI